MRPPAAPPHEAPAAERLWLALQLPRLAVDALSPDSPGPVAATEVAGGRVLIHTPNPAAEAAGVRAGASLSAALSLCSELADRPREPLAEQRLLNRLAERAYGFSSQVAFFEADSVVLEIGASLSLFDGREKLLERLAGALDELGIVWRWAVAPTPRGADWLARAGHEIAALSADALRAALRELPVSLAAERRAEHERLGRSGLHRLGDLYRLPRADLGRRYGKTLLERLDRALGRTAEPLAAFRPAEPFEQAHTFYAPTRDLALIRPAAEELLKALEAHLVRREAAIQHFECRLLHEKAPASVLRVGCRRYARQAEHFAGLLAEHLERSELPEPAAALVIRAGEIHRFRPEHRDLFETTASHNQDWAQLLEQLEARLGAAALRPLHARADYRPEHAHGARPGPAAVGERLARPRPLWLLAEPERLTVRGGRPHWHGPLHLAPDIERIEQGWWDGADVRRDYRIARNPQGSKLWIFRDLRGGGWYLHGLFG